jgi:dTDP-glucose 4,6-dehydratase
MRKFKKLLVTGSLGFIGSAFCHKYRDQYEVFGVDVGGWGSMEENLAPGIHDIRADIADAQQIHSVIEDVEPDAIVNFAAQSHNDRANEDDSNFWRSNVLGSRNLGLEASRRNIWMVQVSTDEVYGDATGNQEPWAEGAPMAPKSSYSVTKAAAEMLLRVYCDSKRHKLKVVITRGANTVGPRQFPEKAIPKAVSRFIKGEQFPLFSTPARRMWMHVDDHVAGIEAALRKGQPGEIYNLAPSSQAEEFTEEIIQRVRNLVGNGSIKKTADRDNYDRRYWMTARKAKECLDWEAEYDLDRTLSSTVTWYLENRDWLEAANRKLEGRQ